MPSEVFRLRIKFSHSFIHSFTRFILCPFKVIYSQAVPTQPRLKRTVFRLANVAARPLGTSGGTTPCRASKGKCPDEKAFALVVALPEFLPCREFIWGINRL